MQLKKEFRIRCIMLILEILKGIDKITRLLIFS
jgi:hypothetical protein